MSAGQEIGSPIRENRTLLPAPLPPDEARGTLAAAAGVSTVGLRPPFDTPAAAFSSRLSRHSHLDCRAAFLSDLRDGMAKTFREKRASIARIFGVSDVAVLNWICDEARKLPDPAIAADQVVITVDEMWHFIQKNSKIIPIMHLT